MFPILVMILMFWTGHDCDNIICTRPSRFQNVATGGYLRTLASLVDGQTPADAYGEDGTLDTIWMPKILTTGDGKNGAPNQLLYQGSNGRHLGRCAGCLGDGNYGFVHIVPDQSGNFPDYAKWTKEVDAQGRVAFKGDQGSYLSSEKQDGKQYISTDATKVNGVLPDKALWIEIPVKDNITCNTV